MTLANFNSNFNWQLRALQQAAGCCGIVPNLPPPTPCYCYEITSITGTCTIEYIDCDGNPQTTITDKNYPVNVCAKENTVNLICLAPFNSATVGGGTVICTNTVECQPLCYYYIYLPDTSNGGFIPVVQEPTLTNSSGTFYPYSSPDWSTMMVTPPYSGNFEFTNDIFYTASNNVAWFWTISPGSPETFTYVDAYGNDYGPQLWSNPICAPSCFSGTIEVLSTSSIYYVQFNQAGVFTQGWQFDITDVNFLAFFIQVLQEFYGPLASATIINLGNNFYQLDVFNIYTELTEIYVTLQDNVTYSLYNIPCNPPPPPATVCIWYADGIFLDQSGPSTFIYSNVATIDIDINSGLYTGSTMQLYYPNGGGWGLSNGSEKKARIWKFSPSAPTSWVSFDGTNSYQLMSWTQCTICPDSITTNYSVTFPTPPSPTFSSFSIYMGDLSSPLSIPDTLDYNINPNFTLWLMGIFGQQSVISVDDFTDPLNVTITIQNCYGCIYPISVNGVSFTIVP